MTLVPFINNACKSAFSQLYNIRRIRKYLTTDISKTLVHAMITSRIDYCSSLPFAMWSPGQLFKETSAGSKRSSPAYNWISKVFSHNSGATLPLTGFP